MLKHACSVSLLWPVSSVLAVPVRFAGTLVIVIDEVSMISAELLRTFENIVRKVVRSNGTYKWHRVPDMTKKHARAFGDGMDLPIMEVLQRYGPFFR